MSSSRPSRTSIDIRTIGSSWAWRCTSVSIASGSQSVKNPPPWIGGNCAGSPSTSSGQSNDIRSRPSSASTIEHSSITISFAFDAGFARAVDQRVNGRGVVAAFVAHHQRRLAGEGREFDLAIDAVRNMPRQRGLAGSGIAEQPEYRRRPVLARFGLEPARHGVERGFLVRGKDGHGISAGDGRAWRDDSQVTKLTIHAPGASASRETELAWAGLGAAREYSV